MIEVPASALAYFENSDVEAAVDHLLASDKGMKTKLAGVGNWSHLASYYRAALTAQQTAIEVAIFLESLWRVVWPNTIPGWRACAPTEPARPDLAVNIATVWDEGSFTRRFEKRGVALELSVGLWPDRLRLGMLLNDANDESILSDGILPEWSCAKGYDTYWTDEEIIPLEAAIDPTPLKILADSAVTVVDRTLKQI